MAVRSTRLFNPVLVTAATFTTLYTVPTGRTAIVHAVVATGYDGGNCTNTRLYIQPASGSTMVIYNFGTVAQDAVSACNTYLVLNPGDSFAFYQSGGRAQVCAFGSLLLGAPS